MMHGLLIIHKERGMTSHQVVAHLRRILKQSRIGHTGTLDPEATGVLVVGLGEGTRSFQFLAEDTKEYNAQIILGQATDTQDATGTVLEEHPQMQISSAQIDQAVHGFLGEVAQLPPMYSAVKVSGQKLYELARRGLEVQRNSRMITVAAWTTCHTSSCYGFKDSFYSDIICSKGTYIRTLIHDLGSRLGCGAHMGQLIRTRSGDFTLENALTISQVELAHQSGTLAEQLIPLHRALLQLPAIYPDAADLTKLNNGGKLSYLKYEL
ncbi:MAG TPA: tRNA pseudouridine(55) synthase TruB, partial [Bacillota bacterium]|nr:tRNA pseudouridine(55) synthase TruB [Bacillota bacterium]